MAEKPKAANGTGSVRKRNGSWEIRWSNDAGRHTKRFPDTKEGRRELQAFQRSLAGLPSALEPTLTFGTWAQKWYEDLHARVDQGKLEESTYFGYQYTLKLLKDVWEDMPLSEISAADIDKQISGLRQKKVIKDEAGEIKEIIEVPYSFGIYKKAKAMTGQIFRAAVKARKISRNDNPMLDVEELVDSSPKKPEKDSYREEDILTVLDRLPGNKFGHAIRVCIGCGLRGQELLPLKVSDVEPDGSIIVVTKAAKRAESTYLGKPKSKSSNRSINVPEFAQASLRWLREHAKNDYIMPNKIGTYIKYRTYLDGYNRAMKKTGVTVLPPHCTRHTYTTNMLIKAGNIDRVVMASTGHSDKRTMEGYIHAHSEDGEAAAAAYNAYILELRARTK